MAIYQANSYIFIVSSFITKNVDRQTKIASYMLEGDITHKNPAKFETPTRSQSRQASNSKCSLHIKLLCIELRTGYTGETVSDEMPLSSLQYSNITYASQTSQCQPTKLGSSRSNRYRDMTLKDLLNQ